MPPVRKAAAAKAHQVNVRLLADSWLRLNAMAGFFGRTQAQLVEDALKFYYEHLAPNDRQAVDQGIRMRQR